MKRTQEQIAETRKTVQTIEGPDYYIELCGGTILIICHKYALLVAITEMYRKEGFRIRAGSFNGTEIVMLQKGV